MRRLPDGFGKPKKDAPARRGRPRKFPPALLNPAKNTRNVRADIGPFAGLNFRQAAFVREYLVDFNGQAAATRAGYSEKTAYAQAAALLKQTQVAAALAKVQAERAYRADISADRVLEEIRRVAMSDVRALFDGEGRLMPLDKLPPEAAACISSMEIITRTRPGSEPVEVEYVAKVKTWDKPAALTLLAKHLGLLIDRVQNIGADGKPIDPGRPVFVVNIT